MKTIFRLSMVLAVAALLVWGGTAEPAEFFSTTDPEYLGAMDRGELPSTPVEFYALSLPAVEAPEVGTWEHSIAMETGSLPSGCADRICGPESYEIAEFGGIPFRVPVDVGP